MVVLNNRLRNFNWAKKSIGLLCNAFSRQFDQRALYLTLANRLEMRQMNMLYRNKRKSTDILSFPNDEYLGEIYICPSYFLKKCRYDPSLFHKHTRKLLIHGLAHLLGYDHETDADYKVMKTIEKRLHLQLPHVKKLISINRPCKWSL